MTKEEIDDFDKIANEHFRFSSIRWENDPNNTGLDPDAPGDIGEKNEPLCVRNY
jgi:hypothetical protein